MGNPQPPETESLIYKLLIYLTGLIVGISAKLAELNTRQKLSIKTFFLHTTVALACSWVVWGLLSHYGHSDWAIWVSPILGRFGDSIIFLLFDAFKEFLKFMVSKSK